VGRVLNELPLLAQLLGLGCPGVAQIVVGGLPTKSNNARASIGVDAYVPTGVGGSPTPRRR
jgi:hypothetical protein